MEEAQNTAVMFWDPGLRPFATALLREVPFVWIEHLKILKNVNHLLEKKKSVFFGRWGVLNIRNSNFEPI